jgi:nicotinamidase-related amidase
MLCDVAGSTLIIIDFQERLMPSIDDGSALMKNAMILAQAARRLDVPVIGTEQNPAGLGPNAAAIKALCDRTIAKSDFNACAQPEFLKALDPARDDLIVAGCEAHVCVLQTVLGLLDAKRRVRLVADAIGSRQPLNKMIAMDRARAAGAEIITTEMVLFEWLRSNDHPGFRELLRLIR